MAQENTTQPKTSTFFLRVIATNKVFYHDHAKALVITMQDGQKEFMPHHEEMIVAIEPGELSIQKADGSWIHVASGYGSMVFANNRATVLVESCETPEELDRIRAQRALDRAKEEMRQKQSIAEYRMSQAAMARALSRLKFKDKYLH